MTPGDSTPLEWRPTEEYLRQSRIMHIMRLHGLQTYDEFYARSVSDPEWFWQAVVRDELDLDWFVPYERVLDLSGGPAWPRWFPGGRFNYVVNAVDRHAAGASASKPAVVFEGEDGAVRTLTYADLEQQINRFAGGLRSLGVRKGDRVGIFAPMTPETVVATLAVSRIGAIYIPTFSGYGAEAVGARLRDAGARVLITADGLYRRGRIVPMKEVADEAVSLAPSVEHMIVMPRMGYDVPWQLGRDIWWDDLVQGQSNHVPTEETASDDPFMIIYTSGTTGKPKGALHVHTGFPIKAAQDMAHCFDIHPSDTLFWFSDLGWMMGPWAIMGALILGATLFIYDGTPDFPGPDRIWSMIERHRVTVLGISPTVIRALMQHGDKWVHSHDLSSLRILGSSGEPWNPDPWEWFFRLVGGNRCPIINYSGGTEVSGGILGCTTILPIRPTSFASPVPGMAADVVDEAGESVRGRVGELVVRRPWVGMTNGFWNDGERYLDTYWSRFPGIWTHGDWALIDEDSFWYIRGRSDDTLKVAGKRVGPAEIESAAASHPAVREAAAIGVPHRIKGEVVTVFVVPRQNDAANDEIREQIRQTIGKQMGKALLPETVLFVDDLPRTRNAKIMRRVIRAAYLEAEPGDLSALENPSSVQSITNAR